MERAVFIGPAHPLIQTVHPKAIRLPPDSVLLAHRPTALIFLQNLPRQKNPRLSETSRVFPLDSSY